MANIRWQGNVSNAWAAAGNWIGGLPADGDTVSFLAADLGANRCAVGPVAAVTLISITDDAGYGGGAAPDICYALITVTTVTILSDSAIAGGTVATATLSGNGSRINGGTIDTATLSGNNTCRVMGGTVTTTYLQGSSRFHATGTTVYENGDQCYIQTCTATTVYLNGTDPRIGNNATITTLYVDSLDAQVSATNIAAGRITNGPYVRNRDAVLYDHDTGNVMLDTSRVLLNHEGIW